MSNAIRYDALLVRTLAAELDTAWRGARLDAAFLERDSLRAVLRTRPPRRSDPAPPSLVWHLHPQSGHITADTGADAEGRVQLPGAARIARVSAPPDERIIIIELDAGDAAAGLTRRIVVELITNQWNVLALSADGRIAAVLRERQTRERTLRAGVEYQGPPRSGRAGSEAPLSGEEWLRALEDVPPGERLRALLTVAYTSPLNAAFILGDADVTDGRPALARAFARYQALVYGTQVEPALIRTEHGWQPYPHSLGLEARATGSLLEAFAAAAAASAAGAAPPVAQDHALAAIARREAALHRRIERLREELAGAGQEAVRLRRHADALLSQLHRVRRGMERAELDDFEGGTLTVELDRSLAPSDNATRMYDIARRRDRAAARIPQLLKKAGQELTRIAELAARVRTGTATDAELQALERAPTGASRDAGPSLPYRAYRTSGGLDVRVGRGSKANDELTFRHSAPTDIWLHARDVAGAHVILRWPHAEANPSARDIEEAAVLAALHSRARTSGVVAVDWTRRKYVRKPRRSPPGAVLPERVRTVFVEPDAAAEERMRVEDLV